MSLTKEQYDGIMLEYTRIQDEDRREQLRRKEEVYRKIPEIGEIEKASLKENIDSLKEALLSGSDLDGKAIKSRSLSLSSQKRSLLLSAGLPANYLDPVYRCPDCRDTGYIGNEKCHCFRAREIALLYNKSRFAELFFSENFSHLSHRWYTGEDLKNFEKAEEASRNFVKNFDTEYQNLYFYGNVGTGKSFLSACIAHELIESGHSVIYFSSSELFQRIASLSFDFQKREEFNALKEDLYGCDLLIIDDLGTEGTNSLTISNLFALISERNLNHRGTIISTNLSLKDLKTTYTERISSRIISFYKVYKFTGKDIRLQKKLGN